MLFLKIACFGILFAFSSIFAQESTTIDLEKIYAGGAAGQIGQCPMCGKHYYVGTHHKCSQKF
jgi:hypothetical protein